MQNRKANPIQFIQSIDAMASMATTDKSTYQALAEKHGGQLGIVSEYWNAHKALPDTPDYDPSDAGYILWHLRDLDQVHHNRPIPPEVLEQFWPLALTAAIAVNATLDFDSGVVGVSKFGVFCYEQLGIEPGELVYELYHGVYLQSSTSEADVVRVITEVAKKKDWPLLARPMVDVVAGAE